MWPQLVNVKSPVVWSLRIKHFCAPSQSQTKNLEIWGGWVGSTYSQSQGCGAEAWSPQSFILLMLSLQIPCSLVVAKLMSSSCAPHPLHRPDSERLKRELHSLECCCAWAYVIGLGVNEKVQNTGEPMPNFFLRSGLYCFLAFFSNFKPPPPPSPSQGLCCFSEHWADSDLHCSCCAPSQHGTLTKAPRGQ